MRNKIGIIDKKIKNNNNKKREPKIIYIINQHVSANIKEYILVITIFLVGTFLGVMFINNSKQEQTSEITAYLNNYIETIKSSENLETGNMLKTSLLQNVGIGIALWFFGTTVIRSSSGIRNSVI